MALKAELHLVLALVRLSWIATVAMALLTPSVSTGAGAHLAVGDAAWARRAEGHDGLGHAHAEPVAEAVRAYALAAAEAPDDVQAHWKLVRALYFSGEFAALDDVESRALFDRGKAAAEAAVEALDRQIGAKGTLSRLDPNTMAEAVPLGLRADAARIHLWSAIAWGAWTRYQGLFAVVRAGVAERLYRSSLVVIALDPELEHGAGHRLLAALHTDLPWVPFFTTWVRRDQALVELARATEIAPGYPGNQLLLALTLLELEPQRRAEAIRLLEVVARSEPDPEETVEQLAMRQAARERLQQHRDHRGTSSPEPRQ